MKNTYRQAIIAAIENASQMIAGHTSGGYIPSLDGKTNTGEKVPYSDEEYEMACQRVAKRILTLMPNKP